MKEYVGGIEAGGTKFLCIIATGPNDICAQQRIPTTTPRETIGRVINFFRNQKGREISLRAIGIASFGPIDVQPASRNFGHITLTPKIGWSGIDLVGPIREALNLPVAFDTDVNAAALAEWHWGSAKGLDDFIYLTIGTGIGGGGMTNGELIHGLVHPEMGHICIPHDSRIDPYAGCCPFHGDCFEGLACGPAITDRWRKSSELLPDEHPAWKLEAHYLALALSNFVYTLSPRRIIVGGGVMQRHQLYPLIRVKLLELLNRYIELVQAKDFMNEFVVAPDLGHRSGTLGAIALAQRLLNC